MVESDLGSIFSSESRFLSKMDELLSPLVCDVHQATQACSDVLSDSFRATKNLIQTQNYHQNSIHHARVVKMAEFLKTKFF